MRLWIAALVVLASLVALLATCGDDRPAPPPGKRDVPPATAPSADAASPRRDPAPARPVRVRAATAEAPLPLPPSATFPPFTPRGGPLLVRIPVQGRAAVLEPEGDCEWHEVGDDAARQPVGWAGSGVMLLRRTRGDDDLEPVFADLRTGEARPAAPGRRIAVLRADCRGVIAFDPHAQALLRVSPASGIATLPAEGVAAVVAVTDRFVFVRDTTNSLVRVPIDGSSPNRLPATLDDFDGDVVPSPSGTRVAVVAGWRSIRGAPDAPKLRMLDAATGAELWRVDRIQLRVGMHSSLWPTLHVAWPDDDRVRWAESYAKEGAATEGTDAILGKGWGQRWIEASAATGERLAVVPYSDALGIRHEDPPTAPTLTAPEWPRRWGLFRTTYEHTFFREDPSPAVRATWAPGAYSGSFVTVSPDGRWAAVCATEDGSKVVVLLDGRECSKRVVHRGDLAGLGWLGAGE